MMNASDRRRFYAALCIGLLIFAALMAFGLWVQENPTKPPIWYSGVR